MMHRRQILLALSLLSASSSSSSLWGGVVNAFVPLVRNAVRTTTTTKTANQVLLLHESKEPTTTSSKDEKKEDSFLEDNNKFLNFLQGAMEDFTVFQQKNVAGNKPSKKSAKQILEEKVEQLQEELQEYHKAEMQLLKKVDKLRDKLSLQEEQHKDSINKMTKQSNALQATLAKTKADSERRIEKYEEQLFEKDSKIEKLQHLLDEKYSLVEKKAEDERVQLQAKYEHKLDAKNHQIYALQLKIKQTKQQVMDILRADIDSN